MRMMHVAGFIPKETSNQEGEEIYKRLSNEFEFLEVCETQCTPQVDVLNWPSVTGMGQAGGADDLV